MIEIRAGGKLYSVSGGLAKIITPAGVAGVTTLYQDSFTDTDGVLVENHTPDYASIPGNHWDDVNTSANWEIYDNRLYATRSASSQFAWTDQGVHDVFVTCDITKAASSPSGGVGFRFLNSTNYWFIHWRYATIRISSLISNVLTVQESITVGESDGTHSVGVLLQGDLITAYFDGSPVCSHSNSDGNTRTKHGLIGLAKPYGDGYYFDNFLMVTA